MRLERFFEKFELLAGAPDAVEKLRTLVLELAVTGRLARQESGEGVASDLIGRIRAERGRLVADGRIKGRPTRPVDPAERPFEAPPSWEWARLSDVGHELGQKVPDQRFTYVDVGSIDSNRGRISERVETLEANQAPSRARKRVVRGTVIYSTVRPYLLNIAIVDRDFDPEPIASTAFGILHPFGGINNRYLFYWLRSARFTAYVQAGMKGVAYPAINDEKFYDGFIPVPPTAEQGRIVAKVDELFALCDRLHAQEQERRTRHATLVHASLARFADAPTSANLNFLFHDAYAIDPQDLRAAILRSAFQGDLTEREGWAESQVAAKQVLADAAAARRLFWQRRHGRNRKYPEPDVHESEDLPRVPAHWLWASVDSVCAQVTDGEHIQPPYQAEGLPMLSAKHVRDGHVTLEGAGLISEDAFQRAVSRCEPENGDILIVSVGATTGRCAIVRNCPRFAIVRSVLLLKPVIHREYLNWWLKNPWAFSWMTRASGASAQPHLYIRDLKRMPVPLAPLAEQLRIVAKVEKLTGLVDALGRQLSASRERADRLMRALVDEMTLLHLGEETS